VNPNREELLFQLALTKPATGRGAWLDRECGDDRSLRQRVEALLAAHEETEGPLAEPAPAATMKIEFTDAPDESIGQKIGRYKILERLGEGGCGVVYVAEQTEPVRRRVALKVIKLGMDTKQVVARFEAERQALAMMDHPNIAKVLDAGTTDTGRPYFIMELVRGIRITDYCDQNRLPTRERLELFIPVCKAIQHAHQKGIIHRDIKPSNILVTLNDGVPVPKVIDFGIAKAIDQPLTEKTLFTRFEQFMGTPAYMSPEQAEMSSLDIDTRTDIYSLGVLLYELLTGKTPFDPRELASAGVDAMRKAIREKEAVRPSTRINTLPGEDRTTTAKRRGADAPRLVSLMRGDLDWITMKCLEKDRTRRYETVNGLAMDIERYLNNEPVVARPPSKLYRFQKLVRRNKLAFAAAAALSLALLLGAIVSAWQAVRASRAEAVARRERDMATHSQQQSEAINRFLTEDLLFQATPDQNAHERKVTMEEVLQRAARRLDENPEITKQPELEATLRLAVGSTYSKLGVLDEAERNLRRSVELRRSALGPDDPRTLAAQAELASFLSEDARKFDEGEALALDTWQRRQRVLGNDNLDTLASMSTYVQSLSDRKKIAEAERLQRQVLDSYRRIFGPDDFRTIDALGNLAYSLASGGNYAEAERYGREELAGFQRIGMADKLNAMYSVNNLAMYRFLQGHPEDAEKLLVEARARSIRVFGPEHLLTLHIQHVLVRILAAEGKLDEAERLARETLAVCRRVTPGHEGTGRTLLCLGQVLVEKGQLDDAEPLLEEALNLFRQNYSMKPELAAQAANWLGTIQLARHRYAEAEALLLPSVDPILASTAGLSPAEQRTAIEHVVQLYRAWGKREDAARWQRKLDLLAGNTSH
jgi:serine/threonine protein kinase/Flp pilus assembly protein TadD